MVVTVSFVVKFSIASTCESLSTDYGTYLRLADILRGFDLIGKGLRYPPLFPLLLNMFLIFFDEITALKVCAAFLYSIIAIPFFFLARKFSRNPVLSLIASLLIVFNVFYSEMMGWGGNANILALSFMISFLVFWLNSLENGQHKRDELLASFFLSLAIGSHFLVGTYVLIFFLVFPFFLALFRTHLETKKTIKKTLFIGLIGLIFSIPYLYDYTYLLSSPITQETNFSVADQRSLVNVTYFLGKNLISIILIPLGIIGIYIFIRKTDKLRGLIIATLFISACLPLFTQHAARWLYFWPVSVFLGIIALVKLLLSQGKKFLGNIANATVAIGVIILIFIYMLNSVQYLQETCVYYNALSDQSLDALKWIKDENQTSKDSIIATSGPYKRGGEGGGHTYGWWIEGYSDRRCIATSYLRWLMYEDERTLAEKANIIFSGTDVITNCYVMAAETFGTEQGNPEIGVNIGDFYEKILFFGDNDTTIICNNGSLSRNITLSQMEIKSKSILLDENTAIIKVTYLGEFLSVYKEISIFSYSSSVDVSFKIQHEYEVNITKIIISIFKSDFVDLNGFNDVSNKSVTFYLTSPEKVYVQMDVSIEYEENVETKVFADSSLEKKSRLVTFILSGPYRNPSFRFKLTLPKLINGNSHSLEYFNAYDLIEELEINYILVNKNYIRQFEWLSSDNVHFSKEFENKEVAIFEVLLDNFPKG